MEDLGSAVYLNHHVYVDGENEGEHE